MLRKEIKKVYLDDKTYKYVQNVLGVKYLSFYNSHLGFSYEFNKLDDNRNKTNEYLIKSYYYYNTKFILLEVIYKTDDANQWSYTELRYLFENNEITSHLGSYPGDFDFGIISMLKHKSNILHELIKSDLLYVPEHDFIIK
jgi:hypothetical protein